MQQRRQRTEARRRLDAYGFAIRLRAPLDAVWVTALAIIVCAPAWAEIYILVGGGVLEHTSGGAQQISLAPREYPGLRMHYTHWQDNSALSAAYDFRLRELNLSFGGALAQRRNGSLTRKSNFYLEAGWQFHPRLRCQLTHFSSTSDDAGENLALCGVTFLAP